MSSTSPRVPLIQPDDWTPAQDAAYAVMSSSATRDIGASANLTTAMANHPRLAAAFYTLGRYILLDQTLPERLREIVTLRVAWRTRSEYEWCHHIRSGLRAGLTDAEIDAVGEGAGAAIWSAQDRCVLRITDQLMDQHRVEDADWNEAAGFLDRQALMDLVFTVGHYILTAWAISAFEVQIEKGFERPEHPLP